MSQSLDVREKLKQKKPNSISNKAVYSLSLPCGGHKSSSENMAKKKKARDLITQKCQGFWLLQTLRCPRDRQWVGLSSDLSLEIERPTGEYKIETEARVSGVRN